jgi:hypothetical protein
VLSVAAHDWCARKTSVDFSYFLSQIRGLTDYLMIVLGSRPHWQKVAGCYSFDGHGVQILLAQTL